MSWQREQKNKVKVRKALPSHAMAKTFEDRKQKAKSGHRKHKRDWS